jgi:hypothetical protein
MKTAKIATAVCFELDCPDCGPESQVEGPAGSLFSTVEEFVVEGKLAYCIDCGSRLAMPRLPKRVRT